MFLLLIITNVEQITDMMLPRLHGPRREAPDGASRLVLNGNAPWGSAFHGNVPGRVCRSREGAWTGAGAARGTAGSAHVVGPRAGGKWGFDGTTEHFRLEKPPRPSSPTVLPMLVMVGPWAGGKWGF